MYITSGSNKHHISIARCLLTKPDAVGNVSVISCGVSLGTIPLLDLLTFREVHFLPTFPIGVFTMSKYIVNVNLFHFLIENVAVNKLASQSGSHYDYSTADKAVDGNSNWDMKVGSCTHPGMLLKK